MNVGELTNELKKYDDSCEVDLFVEIRNSGMQGQLKYVGKSVDSRTKVVGVVLSSVND